MFFWFYLVNFNPFKKKRGSNDSNVQNPHPPLSPNPASKSCPSLRKRMHNVSNNSCTCGLAKKGYTKTQGTQEIQEIIQKNPKNNVEVDVFICCFLCWFDSLNPFCWEWNYVFLFDSDPFFWELALKKTSMNHKNGLTGPLEVSTKKMDEMMFRSWLRPLAASPCIGAFRAGRVNAWERLKPEKNHLYLENGSYHKNARLLTIRLDLKLQGAYP